MARTRRHTPRRSNAFIGLVAVAVIAVIMYFGFTKDVPFTSGFQLKAQFQSANSIRPNSPVRIAGVEVGKVKAVEVADGKLTEDVVYHGCGHLDVVVAQHAPARLEAGVYEGVDVLF